MVDKIKDGTLAFVKIGNKTGIPVALFEPIEPAGVLSDFNAASSTGPNRADEVASTKKADAAGVGDHIVNRHMISMTLQQIDYRIGTLKDIEDQVPTTMGQLNQAREKLAAYRPAVYQVHKKERAIDRS